MESQDNPRATMSATIADSATSAAAPASAAAAALLTDQQPPPQLLRPIFCDLGPITRADGSAQLSHGRTTMMACVYGPCEVRAQSELIDAAAVDVVFKPKLGQPAVAERAKEAVVRNTVAAAVLAAMHPRTAVNVVVQELEDDGGGLSCAVNAACLSLLDASVAMSCLFAAVTVAVAGDGAARDVVDPGRRDLRRSRAAITFVFESNAKEVLTLHMSGKCSEADLQRCLGTAKEAADNIFHFYRQAVKRKFSKEFA